MYNNKTFEELLGKYVSHFSAHLCSSHQCSTLEDLNSAKAALLSYVGVLVVERDEARRELCEVASFYETPDRRKGLKRHAMEDNYAVTRGWQYLYKEEK
jgi:hypothetical protein